MRHRRSDFCSQSIAAARDCIAGLVPSYRGPTGPRSGASVRHSAGVTRPLIPIREHESARPQTPTIPASIGFSTPSLKRPARTQWTGMKTALCCRAFGILILSFVLSPARADQPAGQSASQSNGPRYTFSWQLGQANAPAPRGGTTRGPAIELDTELSPAGEHFRNRTSQHWSETGAPSWPWQATIA